MSFAYLKEITDSVQKSGKEFWRVVMESDMQERNVSEEESFETMRSMYRAMEEADSFMMQNFVRQAVLQEGMETGLKVCAGRAEA